MRRGEGNAIVGADGPRQAAFVKQALKGGKGEFFAIGFQRFTQQQVARAVVGDGQRITIPFIAELKLALVVGAPEIIGQQALGQGRPLGSTAAPTHGCDQTMTIEHGVNGRGGRSLDGMWQAPQQALPDFACAPVRFSRLALTMAAST